jgi:membrane fusion protein (multidrug efflux system)
MWLLKQLLTLVLLGGLASGGYFVYRNHVGTAAEETAATAREQRPVPVEVIVAEEADIARSVEAVGTTRALQSVDIVPLASGRIESLSIVPGKEIEQGTVIATLDDEIERATLAETEAALQEKSRALERAQTLVSSNTMSQATLEQLRSEHAIAQAAVDRARRRLADRTVRAPFRGVLGLTSVDLGARVDDETVLTTIDDLSEVEIQFSLPEMVYGQVRIGQEVQAGAAAFSDRTFVGDVVAIDSRIDATSRAFRARARLPNPERLLPAGMFVHLVLELDARRGVTVPEEAIAVEGGASFVFVVADGKAERRRVTLGKRTVGRVEIAGGVAVGDQVVVAGIQSLRDGSAVDVRSTAEDEGVGTAVAPAPSERS